ncbi:mitochondrial tRNA-specific 2-thiouridylase 1-like isoform X2 [Ostrea edulis]|uniref:mitochondrial tRNA-specific 2-thiouridylase 1-like isoform X2 n=1 Tax=Ostrea edulis TaxID=37623 RepID=UPI0024AFB6D4|nr:mitochondrial tRNA-specific 2-thiouridylase 1-like isoform X2 [Ostrea edulis]
MRKMKVDSAQQIMTEMMLNLFVSILEFHSMGPFLKDYQSGSVPNPDIVCNRQIKFGVFLRHALKQFSADAIATGHYARTSVGENLQYKDSNIGVKLLKARDSWKDQTFFLSQIPQSALQRVLFPLGDLLKSEVKHIASEVGLQRIARKRESMGICFVGKRKFPTFIGEYIEPRPGNVIHVETGEVVGDHQGIHHYTLGQRIIHVNHGRFGKCFIVDKNNLTQDIIIAPGTNHPALFNEEFYTTLPNWINKEPTGFSDSKNCDLECRFQRKVLPVPCIVNKCSGEQVRVTLSEPMRSITPGQYAVFYNGEECLGSGVITQKGPSLYDLQQGQKITHNQRST